MHLEGSSAVYSTPAKVQRLYEAVDAALKIIRGIPISVSPSDAFEQLSEEINALNWVSRYNLAEKCVFELPLERIGALRELRNTLEDILDCATRKTRSSNTIAMPVVDQAPDFYASLRNVLKAFYLDPSLPNLNCIAEIVHKQALELSTRSSGSAPSPLRNSHAPPSPDSFVESIRLGIPPPVVNVNGGIVNIYYQSPVTMDSGNTFTSNSHNQI
ncbi:hypothetical protein H0H92_009167 [Tricholoma furcatifolium]|nr:hypothetical protein H0H92_009167 [Tricholoma furcatifolium]